MATDDIDYLIHRLGEVERELREVNSRLMELESEPQIEDYDALGLRMARLEGALYSFLVEVEDNED